MEYAYNFSKLINILICLYHRATINQYDDLFLHKHVSKPPQNIYLMINVYKGYSIVMTKYVVTLKISLHIVLHFSKKKNNACAWYFEVEFQEFEGGGRSTLLD